MDEYIDEHPRGTGGWLGRAETAHVGHTDELVAICTVRKPHEQHVLRLLKALGPETPSIISLKATCEDFKLNRFHFVFEWMNQNLAQLITSRRGAPLQVEAIAAIGKKIVTGLTYIHSAGFAHRNLRPSNILVTETAGDVEVKLTDFSQAWPIHQPIKVEFTNTPKYRAPEQLVQADNASSQIDIWAYGVVMAELCNLQPLFLGSTPQDVAFRQKLLVKKSIRDKPDYGRRPAGSRARHMIRGRHTTTLQTGNILRYDEHEILGPIIAPCLSIEPLRRPTAQHIHHLISKLLVSTDTIALHQPSIIHERMIWFTRRMHGYQH